MNLSQIALHRCLIYMHMDSLGSPLTVWELWSSRVSASFVCMQVNRVCGEQFSPKHQLLSTDTGAQNHKSWNKYALLGTTMYAFNYFFKVSRLAYV